MFVFSRPRPDLGAGHGWWEEKALGSVGTLAHGVPLPLIWRQAASKSECIESNLGEARGRAASGSGS